MDREALIGHSGLCAASAPPAAHAGFTLIELMVAMCIGGILLAIGVPAFRYVTNSSRTTTEINTLLTSFQYARMEAVKEGKTVTICASATGATCSGATDWSTGWIVFSDTNANQQVDASATSTNEPVRLISPALTHGDTLSGGTLSAVTYNRLGSASIVATTFELHDSTTNKNWTRCLQLNQAGKVLTQRYGGTCQ